MPKQSVFYFADTFKKKISQTYRNRLEWWLPELGGLVKGYKFSVIKWTSYANVMYTIVTLLNNTVIYWKFARTIIYLG